MTTEEIRRKAELRVGTIGVNEETQKALVNWIVLTVREATAQNTSHTTEDRVEKWLPVLKQAHEYQLNAGYPSDLNELVKMFKSELMLNTADTLEQFRKVVDVESYDWDRGKEEWERYTKSLTPTPLEEDKTKTS